MGDKVCESAVMESLKAFKAAGGGCIVENSTFGLHRRTSFLKELSQETGVHIIAGTGISITKVNKKYHFNFCFIKTFKNFDCGTILFCPCSLYHIILVIKV